MQQKRLINNYSQLNMLSTQDVAGHRPATSSVHYTTSCNTQSSAPEDGQNNCPRRVELTGIINKPLLLHLVGCLYSSYQWCAVKQISYNETFLFIKYIKSVLWWVAKRLSYIEDSRCLKFKHSNSAGPNTKLQTDRRHSRKLYFLFCTERVMTGKSTTTTLDYRHVGGVCAIYSNREEPRMWGLWKMLFPAPAVGTASAHSHRRATLFVRRLWETIHTARPLEHTPEAARASPQARACLSKLRQGFCYSRLPEGNMQL